MLIQRRLSTHSRPSCVVAIGNFDGIHLGHQKLLETVRLLAKEQQATSCLLTFDPYPQAFFNSGSKVARLTTLREKAFLLKQYAIEQMVVLPFDQRLANYSAQSFIQEILLKQLNAIAVVVGNDFHFGHQREGNVVLLKSITHFMTHIVEPVLINNERISSTRVRHVLSVGNLTAVQQLLARYYCMIGRVVKGNRRGRQLGYPTANIALNKRTPALYGVFAVKVYGIGEKIFNGVANIGSRPTVDGTRQFLEVYLFNFSQDIYGEMLRVEFIAKIRDEQRYDSIEALKAQIGKDVVSAREYFK